MALALGLCASPAAAIEVPSCSNCTFPACIRLVASDGTAGSAVGEFSVTVRTLSGEPFRAWPVTIELWAATDLRFCNDQLDPEITVNCDGTSATKPTDANGVATFTLLGYSQGAPTSLQNAGRIYVTSMCASPTVSAFDLDGASGLGANDISVFFADFGSGNPYGRSDFDCSGGVGANDFAVWLAAFGAGTQTVSCGSSCP